MRITTALRRLCSAVLLIALASVSSSALAQPTFTARFDSDVIGPGSISQLRFTIDNPVTLNAVTDLAFINVLPAGVQIATAPGLVTDCVGAVVNAPAGGGTITFSEARLAGGNSCFIELNVTSTVLGTHSNVSGDLTSSAGNSGPAADDLTVVANRVGFSQSFSPSVVNQGERSQLTYTIDNSLNPSMIFLITFSDALTPGLLIASPANASTTCTGGVVTTIPGGTTISLATASVAAGAQCTVTVDIEAVGAGQIENTSGDLTASSGGPSASAGSSASVLTINLGDTLVFTKSFIDDPVVAGAAAQLRYRIINSNRSFAVSNISFTDDLDASLSGLVATGLPLLGSCGAGAVLNGSATLTLTGGSLGPEQSCEFIVTLQTPAGAAAAGYLSTTSAITGVIAGQPFVDLAAVDTLFISEAPSLSKTFLSNPVGAGAITQLEFTLVNNSSVASASSIAFSDQIEPFLSGAVITALPMSGFCGSGSTASFGVISAIDTLFVNNANLPPGGSCSFTVGLIVPANTPTGTYLNTTSNVTSVINGLSQTGNSASASLQVLGAPQLRLLVTDNPNAPGDTANLNFELNLPEDAPAVDTIQFDVDLNAALAGLSATGLPLATPCGVMSQITGTNLLQFTDGALNSGQSCSFDVSLQIPAAANLGSYLINSTAPTALSSGILVTAQPAQATLLVNTVGFSKSFIESPLVQGQLTPLRFTLDNTQGTQDLTNISFTDSLTSALASMAAVGLPLLDPCGTGSSITGTTSLSFNGGNLLAGQSCTFDVMVQIPAAARNGTFINVTSALNLMVGGVSTILPATQAAFEVNNQVLQLSMAFSPDFSPAGASVDLNFTLSNGSNAQVDNIAFTDNLNAALSGMTALGLPLNNPCGMGSVISGTSLLDFSGGSLAAGQSCSFSVTVQVPLNAPAGDVLNQSSSLSGSRSGLSVAGTAATASLRVSRIGFTKSFVNPVVTGQTTTLSYTLTNFDAVQSISGLRFTDDLNAALPGLTVISAGQSNICGLGSQLNGNGFLVFDQGSLAPGANCSFAVTVMVPAGLFPLTVTSSSSDLNQGGFAVAAPAQADLQILGQAGLSLSANSINFGNVRVGTTSPAQVITLSNTGTAMLDVQSITGLAAPFALNGGDCPGLPFSIAPGNSCQLGFNFSPSVAGAANQNLSLLSNAPSNPDGISLQGFGIRPLLSLSSNLLDFASIPLGQTSVVQMLTLSNTGDADLNISALSAVAAPFAQVGGTCNAAPFTLLPAASCSLAYQFTPLVPGAAMSSVNITSDAASSPDSFGLQGFGAEAIIQLDRNLVDFGVRGVGETSTQLLLLSNTGDADLTVSGVTGPNSPFAVLPGTCGGFPVVLLAAMSCELELSFNPTTAGPVMDQFVVNSDANNAAPTVQLRGQGVFVVEVPTLQRWGLLVLIFSLLVIAQGLLRRQGR